MSSTNLKQQATSGIFWTALQRYSALIIQFITGIILARLLTPYDYGCLGMLSIFIVLAETFIDGGFGLALVQKKKTTQDDYSTIFFWNLGLAVLLYIVIYISAPAIARFYNIAPLCLVLRVQGLILFTYAFNIVQHNLLVKNLQFKTLSIASFVASVIALTVAIVLAYSGYGVWSLVALQNLLVFIPALFFWFYVKWRPTWTFSWASFKELFGFGLYMFLINLFNIFCTRIQGLLIGKFFNPSIMGYYSKADRLERFASDSVASIINQVSFPLFAEIQDDRQRLGNVIRKISMVISFFSLPLMFILLLCAKPIFTILYSDRWLGSVPYFQILCIAGLAWSLQSVNYMSISAIGKSKTMFVWTIVKRTVGIAFIVIGLIYYGMIGLLIGVVLNQWFSYFVNMALVSRYIGYKWWKQIIDVLPVCMVSVISGIISYCIGVWCQLPLYADGLLMFFVYMAIYLSWSLLAKPEAYCFTLSVIKPFINKYIRKEL